jgi:hypothetical protein
VETSKANLCFRCHTALGVQGGIYMLLNGKCVGASSKGHDREQTHRTKNAPHHCSQKVQTHNARQVCAPPKYTRVPAITFTPLASPYPTNVEFVTHKCVAFPWATSSGSGLAASGGAAQLMLRPSNQRWL